MGKQESLGIYLSHEFESEPEDTRCLVTNKLRQGQSRLIKLYYVGLEQISGMNSTDSAHLLILDPYLCRLSSSGQLHESNFCQYLHAYWTLYEEIMIFR